MEIDWGDLDLPANERATASRILGSLADTGGKRLLLGRHGSGYEASIELEVHGRTTAIRLHAERLFDVIERVVELSEIVRAEQTEKR
jgi:hypothetical protein